MCEAGSDASRGMLFRRRWRGRVRSISGRGGGSTDLLRGELMPVQYSSGSRIVLDAREASVMIQTRIFGAMWYEEKTRAPSAMASRFALMSTCERFDQSPVTWWSSNVAGVTAWAVSATCAPGVMYMSPRRKRWGLDSCFFMVEGRGCAGHAAIPAHLARCLIGRYRWYRWLDYLECTDSSAAVRPS